MMTDPIADLLTRLRNMNRLGRRKVTSIPYSKLKERILDALQREGFIDEFSVEGEGTQKSIRVLLKFAPTGEPAISKIERVSTPGRRVYRGVKELTRMLHESDDFHTVLIPLRDGVSISIYGA